MLYYAILPNKISYNGDASWVGFGHPCSDGDGDGDGEAELTLSMEVSSTTDSGREPADIPPDIMLLLFPSRACSQDRQGPTPRLPPSLSRFYASKLFFTKSWHMNPKLKLIQFSGILACIKPPIHACRL